MPCVLKFQNKSKLHINGINEENNSYNIGQHFVERIGSNLAGRYR